MSMDRLNRFLSHWQIPKLMREELRSYFQVRNTALSLFPFF